MNRSINRKFTVVILAMILALAGAAVAQNPLPKPGFRADGLNAPANHDFKKVAPGKDYAPGRIIVRFKDEVQAAGGQNRQAAAVRALGGKKLNKFAKIKNLNLVQLPPQQSVEDALVAYNDHPDVLYAEPDYIVQKDDTFPNDPYFNLLWHLHQDFTTVTRYPWDGMYDVDIDAPEAWDFGTGLDPEGEPMVVAVIDTGVNYNHEDLTSTTQIWLNLDEMTSVGLVADGVDNDGNGYVDDLYGWDFYGNSPDPDDFDNDPMDTDGHGTHVAGTIGAIGNNGIGVTGVCWNVQIMPLRFLGPSGGFTSDAVEAVYYAVDNGADVLNNSWGGGGFTFSLYEAIEYARMNDVLFVAAAGNGDFFGNPIDNDQQPHYPSSYPNDNVISVMASDENDNPASFSNYGLFSVDLAAPGVNIYSTIWDPFDLTSAYEYLSGTSMATPVVAGACALYKSLNPDAAYDEIRDRIFEGVEPGFEGLCVTGGRLNLYGTLTRQGAIDFNAESFDGEQAIYLTWQNPTDSSFSEVLIRRSGSSYPTDPLNEGDLIYTGNAELFVDNNVVIDEHYFYTIWARYDDGSYSSPQFDDAFAGQDDPDFFTERFNSQNPCDLEGRQLVFRPASGTTNFYEMEVRDGAQFPVEPTQGTRWYMSDNDYRQIDFPLGQTFNFYGVDYTSAYVGSNGYITFEMGDTASSPTLQNHFYFYGSYNSPRISAFFNDLHPESGGAIYTQTMDDRFVASWVDVVDPYPGINSFQVELFFDGTIRITYPSLNTIEALVGLSAPESFPRPDLVPAPGSMLSVTNNSDYFQTVYPSNLSEYPYFWQMEEYYDISYTELAFPANVEMQINEDRTIVISPDIPQARGVLRITRKPGKSVYPEIAGIYCGGSLRTFLCETTVEEMFVKGDLLNASVRNGYIGELNAGNIGKVRMLNNARSSSTEGMDEDHTSIYSGDTVNVFVNSEGTPYGQRIPTTPTGDINPTMAPVDLNLAGVSLDNLWAPNQRVELSIGPKKHIWTTDAGLKILDLSLGRISTMMEHSAIEVGHLLRLNATGGGAWYNPDKAAIGSDLIEQFSRQEGRAGRSVIIGRTLNTVVGRQSSINKLFEPRYESYLGTIDVTTMTLLSDDLAIGAFSANLYSDLIQNTGSISVLQALEGTLDVGLVQSGTDNSFLNPHISRIIGYFGVDGVFQAGVDALGSPDYRGRIFLIGTRYPYYGLGQPGSAAITGSAYVSDEEVRLLGDTEAVDEGRFTIFTP